MNSNGRKRLCIVAPCYNDWDALQCLVKKISETRLHENHILELLVVDDCSSIEIQSVKELSHYSEIEIITVLRLKRNLGHQRAITSGLCYLSQNGEYDLIVVMDSDGEDNPDTIIDLINASARNENKKIIFARRSKRSERLAFRFFYMLYTIAFRLLTGDRMRVGNFSLIPGRLLHKIGVISELWNHYSAGLRRSGIPFYEISIPRAKRFCGKSKMNLVTLITHGLSSIAVYGEIVATRILIFSAFSSGISILGMIIVIIVRFSTTWTLPGSGYTTYMVSFLGIGLFQSVFMGLIFSMIVLSARSNFSQIPIKEYESYVDYIKIISQQDAC